MTRTSPKYIQGRVIIYLYLPLGRLTRENDEDRSVTICYNYDSNGNILSKVEYPYTTGALTSATRTVPYTYAVSWGDQLLTYNNGSTILYDQIGNPLSYNGYTFTWQKGRQLASANDGTNSYQFIYNADGQRTWKTKNNSSTQYTYASGLLISQTDGTNTLNFTYDPDGIALGVNLNGTDYYYLYNAQGDVIALYDSAGTVVTEYKYDSWGKVLSMTGSAANTIGTLNPIRYRGYFYDNDLDFYLLETRYYDPETGRFINADDVVDNQGPSATNTYAYCYNDPINHEDENGRGPAGFVAGLVVGGIAETLTAYTNGKRGWGLAGAFAKGALTNGALGLLGIGLGKIPKYTKTIKTLGTALAGASVNYYNNKQNRSGTTKKKKKNTVGTANSKSNTSKKSSSNKSRTNSQGVKIATSNYRVKGFSDEAHDSLRAAIAGALGTGFSSAAGTYTSTVLKELNADVWTAVAEFGIAIYYETIGSAFQAISDHSMADLYPGEQDE